MSRTSYRWSRLDSWERGALLVALSCLLAAFGVRPLVRTLDPELAVAAAYPRWVVFFDASTGQVAPGRSDPWGHPFRWREVAQGQGNWYLAPGSPSYLFYSSGPDGVDDAGSGDDVVLRGRHGALVLFWSTELLCVGALGVLWVALGPFVRAPPHPSLLLELGRSLVIASVPAGISITLIIWAASLDWVAEAVPDGPLLAHHRLSWIGSAALPWVCVGLFLRLRQRGEGEESEG